MPTMQQEIRTKAHHWLIERQPHGGCFKAVCSRCQAVTIFPAHADQFNGGRYPMPKAPECKNTTAKK